MKQTDGDLNRVKGHHKDVLWNSQTANYTGDRGKESGGKLRTNHHSIHAMHQIAQHVSGKVFNYLP